MSWLIILKSPSKHDLKYVQSFAVSHILLENNDDHKNVLIIFNPDKSPIDLNVTLLTNGVWYNYQNQNLSKVRACLYIIAKQHFPVLPTSITDWTIKLLPNINYFLTLNNLFLLLFRKYPFKIKHYNYFQEFQALIFLFGINSLRETLPIQ